jgi:hypothetical protein
VTGRFEGSNRFATGPRELARFTAESIHWKKVPREFLPSCRKNFP